MNCASECCVQETVWLPVTVPYGSQCRDVHADSAVTAAEPCHCPTCDIPASWNRQDIHSEAKGHSKAASWNCSWKAVRINSCCVSTAKCQRRRWHCTQFCLTLLNYILLSAVYDNAGVKVLVPCQWCDFKFWLADKTWWNWISYVLQCINCYVPLMCCTVYLTWL